MKIGSLCTGYGGLDQSVQAVLGGDLVWVADPDPGAAALLAHHHPDVPNLGDITVTDWDQAEGVDIITAGYPCFVAGTMILTNAGYRPIEELAPGDMVLTHEGRWRPVTSAMSRDDAELWQVRAGNPITTTPEHPFFATSQGRQWNNTRRRYERTISGPHWTDSSDLVPWRSRVGHVLPPVTPAQETDGAIWWLAGRYLADGYRQRRTRTGSGNPVNSDQGKVILACGRGKEPELRDQLKRAGLHATESPDRNVTKFVLSGPRMYQFTAAFGQGAHNKSLPASALALPADLAEELLSGWLSGDGHRDKSSWVGTTVSKALALGMVLLAHRARGVLASLSLTVPAPTKVIEGRTVNQHSWWRVSIPATNRRGIVDGDRAWKFVTESSTVPEKARVFNISVEGDESYIADGVIVHNCQPFSVAGNREGASDERHIWPYVAEAVRRVRPRHVFLENVPGHLSLGFGRVVADLASLGYVGSWRCVRASDVDAAHRRERVFILASDAQGVGRNARRTEPEREQGRPDAAVRSGSAPADTAGEGREARREGLPGTGRATTDSDRDPVRQQPITESGGSSEALAELADVDWNQFGPAIDRWACAIGRPAPDPTESAPRGGATSERCVRRVDHGSARRLDYRRSRHHP